jgi:KDO2-lipid IV(A) lauroyltransferase
MVFVVGLLPVEWASTLGGAIFGWLGPIFGARRARHNLTKSFPDWTQSQIDRTIAGMWKNLGSTAFECAHLEAFKPYRDHARVKVIGAEIVADIAAQGRPVIYFSGHLGNWELMTMAVRQHPAYADHDDKVCLIYRALNNPLADAQLLHQRRAHITKNAFPKGASGARGMIDFLRRKGAVCMLIDQKMNDGIPVPFFGRMAMTAPAAAQMALRYDAVLVPVSNIRLDGARFEITFHPPLEITPSGDKAADATTIMRMCNAFLEERIRAHPDLWFWVHRRWPD